MNDLLRDKTLAWTVKSNWRKIKWDEFHKRENCEVETEFARTLRPQAYTHTHAYTHSLLHKNQRYCSSFLKGEDKYDTVSGISAVRYTNTAAEWDAHAEKRFELSHAAGRQFGLPRSPDSVWFGEHSKEEEVCLRKEGKITANCRQQSGPSDHWMWSTKEPGQNPTPHPPKKQQPPSQLNILHVENFKCNVCLPRYQIDRGLTNRKVNLLKGTELYHWEDVWDNTKFPAEKMSGLKEGLNMYAENSFFFICSIATKEDFSGWPRRESPSAVQLATEEQTEEGSVVWEEFRASGYVYAWVSLWWHHYRGQGLVYDWWWNLNGVPSPQLWRCWGPHHEARSYDDWETVQGELGNQEDQNAQRCWPWHH